MDDCQFATGFAGIGILFDIFEAQTNGLHISLAGRLSVSWNVFVEVIGPEAMWTVVPVFGANGSLRDGGVTI